jgi:hypothetical protein
MRSLFLLLLLVVEVSQQPATGTIRVSVRPRNGGSSELQTTTDSSGHFLFRDISPTGLIVTSSTPDPIEFVFASTTGTLLGNVQSSDPSVAAYAWVTVAPTAEHRDNRILYRSVRANAEGRFQISGIVPGEYKLFAFAEIPYYASENPGFLSRYETLGVPLHISGGETTTISPNLIAVLPASTITAGVLPLIVGPVCPTIRNWKRRSTLPVEGQGVFRRERLRYVRRCPEGCRSSRPRRPC